MLTAVPWNCVQVNLYQTARKSRGAVWWCEFHQKQTWDRDRTEKKNWRATRNTEKSVARFLATRCQTRGSSGLSDPVGQLEFFKILPVKSIRGGLPTDNCCRSDQFLWYSETHSSLLWYPAGDRRWGVCFTRLHGGRKRLCVLVWP